MATRACALALLVACLCAVALPGAFGQTVPPVTVDETTFSGFNDTAYNIGFARPMTKNTTVVANPSPVLPVTGIRSNMFFIKPCSFGTVPHYHPAAAEYFVAIEGTTEVFVYSNNRLIRHTIKAGDAGFGTHIAPKNHLHWYYNQECEPSTMLAVLNPPPGQAPGFFGFFNTPTPLPRAITDGRATTEDVKELIKRPAQGQPAPPAAPLPTIFDLTNNCLRKCAKKYKDDCEDDKKKHKRSFKKRGGKGRH